MRRLVLAVALGVGAVPCAAQSAARGALAPAHAAAMRDSARTFLADLEKTFASGDRGATAGMYSSDARFRWVESGRITARSAAQIAEYLRQMPAGMKVATTYTDPDFIPLAPGLIQVVSPFQTTLGDPAAGGVSFGGMLTMILVHEGDGWRLLHGHASSPDARGR